MTALHFYLLISKQV